MIFHQQSSLNDQRSHGSHSIRPQSHRIPAHRRGPHGPVQLALRPATRRPVHPADRRHRSAAERGRGVAADPRRPAVAGHRLGRGARSGRAVRALLPIAAARSLPGGGEKLLAGGHAYYDYATTEELQAERRRPSARSGRSATAAASWPRRRPIGPASSPKAGRPSCG